MDNSIKLCHGNGGSQTEELIRNIFYKHFNNEILLRGLDSAILEIGQGRIAFTTDTFVVKPIFFLGGNIGKLAICGTINDLVAVGAKPLYISCGMIIEEGFDLELLEKIVISMKETADLAGVSIVTGDTKVVEKGAVDQVFINTSGIGRVLKDFSIKEIFPGDKIIMTGSIAEHGTTIAINQYNLNIKGDFQSDCNPLTEILECLKDYSEDIKFMRDPTRGGVATVLNEMSKHSGLSIHLYEKNIPIRPEVTAINELLGLEPLYIASEGRMILVVREAKAKEILENIRKLSNFKNANIIGAFIEDINHNVIAINSFGGKRIITPLEGEMVPRIC